MTLAASTFAFNRQSEMCIRDSGMCDGEAELGAHVHLEYYVNGAPEDLSAILG